jgi:hypothetical protein
MTLADAIVSIEDSSEWGIWAEEIDGKFSEDSDARYGQKCFENGGVLDGKIFVCNGYTANRFLGNLCDEDDELIPGWFTEFMEYLEEP